MKRLGLALFSFVVSVLLTGGLFVPVAFAQVTPVLIHPEPTTTTAPLSIFPMILPSPARVVQGQLLDDVVKNSNPSSVMPWNVLRFLIATAVSRGVSSQLIVLILLFPVIASMVAFARHVLGVSGFSIYAPAALAIVLLSTGIGQGGLLFLCMLLIASIGKPVLSRLKLEYIPRTAMLLWFVAVGLFGILLLFALSPVKLFQHIDVFPLLVLVLLSEDFIGMQSELKVGAALSRSLQMLLFAVVGALFIRNIQVQQFVLANPEIVVVGVAVLNFIVGKYVGLRLTEYLRFKPMMDTEE